MKNIHIQFLNPVRFGLQFLHPHWRLCSVTESTHSGMSLPAGRARQTALWDLQRALAAINTAGMQIFWDPASHITFTASLTRHLEITNRKAKCLSSFPINYFYLNTRIEGLGSNSEYSTYKQLLCDT
jgi:hypothetical protein